MRLTLCGATAMAITRSIRSGMAVGIAKNLSWIPRCDVIDPQLDQGMRWTARRVDLSRFKGVPFASQKTPVHVAVSDANCRIRAKFARNTVYEHELPKDAFLYLGDGIAISSPELLFLEMSKVMSPAAHALLGFELCGTFSRSPTRPRLGEAMFGIAPATTVDKIRDFLDRCGEGNNAVEARKTLAVIADNAWSPMEAVLATLMALPVTEYGYGMGPVILNERVNTREVLGGASTLDSRVPDVRVQDTTVGVNYDGHEHMDLDALIELATMSDGSVERAADLETTKRLIREKSYDDLLRNRELSASGLLIMPASSEDLFRKGATDRLMTAVAVAIEKRDGRDMSKTFSAIASDALAQRRQLLIWSLLPWEHGIQAAKKLEELERRSMSGGTCSEVIVFDERQG